MAQQKFIVSEEFNDVADEYQVFSKRQLRGALRLFGIYQNCELEIDEGKWHPDLSYLKNLNPEIFGADSLLPRVLHVDSAGSAYKRIYEEAMSGLPEADAEYIRRVEEGKGVDFAGEIGRMGVHLNLISMGMETQQEATEHLRRSWREELAREEKEKESLTPQERARNAAEEVRQRMMLNNFIMEVAYKAMQRYGEIVHLDNPHKNSLLSCPPDLFFHATIDGRPAAVPMNVESEVRFGLEWKTADIHPGHWRIYLDEMRKGIE